MSFEDSFALDVEDKVTLSAEITLRRELTLNIHRQNEDSKPTGSVKTETKKFFPPAVQMSSTFENSHQALLSRKSR